MKSFVFIACFVFCGCVSENDNAQILTTNNWEGHYMTTDDFHRNTEDIRLKKGESIWVMSNVTLKKLLKTRENK